MGWKGDPHAFHDDVSGEIEAVADKASLADGDHFLIEDSAASDAKKSMEWSTMKGDVQAVLTTEGDLLYRDGSGWQRLAVGSAGDFLRVNDAGDAPEWGDGPRGVLGYAEITSGQTGISSETDLTGLSVAVDVAASRRIKITASVNIRQRTSAGIAIVRIKEGSTNLRRADNELAIDDFATAQVTRVIESPSVGSHTYKLTALTTAGTVDINADDDVTHGPASILVEDIGPS